MEPTLENVTSTCHHGRKCWREDISLSATPPCTMEGKARERDSCPPQPDPQPPKLTWPLQATLYHFPQPGNGVWGPRGVQVSLSAFHCHSEAHFLEDAREMGWPVVLIKCAALWASPVCRSSRAHGDGSGACTSSAPSHACTRTPLELLRQREVTHSISLECSMVEAS